MSVAGTYEVLPKRGARMGSYSHSTDVNNEAAARDAAHRRAQTVADSTQERVKVVYRNAEGALVASKTINVDPTSIGR